MSRWWVHLCLTFGVASSVHCRDRSDEKLHAPAAGGRTGAEAAWDATAGPSPGACTPGESVECYDGPGGTLGVGDCKAGLRHCAVDGTFGACMGQVLPTTESCTTAFDDDCDGLTNEAGDDCICAAGEVMSCYTGPPAAIGVGPCIAGQQTCLPTGAGFGTCTGEVLPAGEDCTTPIDEDCDAEPDCPGAIAWVVGHDSTNVVSIAHGAQDTVGLLVSYPQRWLELAPAGSVSLVKEFLGWGVVGVLGGDATGTAQVVGGLYSNIPTWEPQLPFGNEDVFVSKRNGWLRAFEYGANGPPLTFATFHPTDSPPGWYFAGQLWTTLKLTPNIAVGGSASQPFMMKLDASTGDASFGRILLQSGAGTSAPPQIRGMQSVTKGAAVVTEFYAQPSIDGTTLTSAGHRDVFLAVVDGAGTTKSWTTFGGQYDDGAEIVGRSGVGPIVLAGVTGGMSVGSFKLASGAYLLRMTDDLKPISALEVPDCNIGSLALDDVSEDVYAVLYCSSGKNFGGNTLPAGFMLVAFEKNNQARFSRALPYASYQRALAQDGALYLAGSFSSGIDFGDGKVLVTQSGSRGFVAKLTK